ncbi:MAG: FG-GAP repeat protein, partial [Planctomycetes bacterium]|nr:FG-GAP repeat protein [Planctomycetota bacterium]
AGLGDVNGDGSPDFAVGAAGIATPSGLGQVFVYSGTNGSPILTLDNPSSAAGFGGSLARAGDLDGDGLPDLAVCAISLTGPSWIGAFGFTRTGCIAGTSAVPVLQVNGDASPFQFTCLAQPMVITLDQPASQLIPSNWVLWGMLAPFSSQTQYGIPPVLCLLPQHLFPSNPALFTLGNAFYPADPLAVVPGVHAAPFAFHVPGGIPVATTFSLQGLIEDAASYPAPWAVTNGIQVTVH